MSKHVQRSAFDRVVAWPDSSVAPHVASGVALPGMDWLAIGLPELAAPPPTTADSWKSAISGSWSTAADWSLGTVPNASNDATIAVAGAYTVTIGAPATANSLTVNDANGTVNDSSTLSLTTTLALQAGAFDLFGTLAGGTIAVTGGNFVTLGGTLSGTSVQGSLAVTTGRTLYIVGGLGLSGAGGIGSASVSVGGGSPNGSGDLRLLDSETLNNATVTLYGSSGYGGILENYGANQTLALGSSLTVTQTTGANLLENDYGTGVINNAGTFSVAGGSLEVYGGTLNNAGLLNVSAGYLSIYSATVSSPGSLATSGTGSIYLSNTGTFTGTVNAGSANIVFAGGTLSAAKWEGSLAIGTGYAYATGGLSFTGAGGSGAGAISISGSYGGGGNGYLQLLDSETLSNATLTLAGIGKYGGVLLNSGANQTLTLGTSFVITATSGTDLLQSTYSTGVISNAGTISVTGGVVNLIGGSFSNSGLVTVSAGNVSIQTAVNSAGSLATSGTGVIVLSSTGTFTGTVNAGSANIAFGGGTLSAAIWQGLLNIGNGSAYVTNGLTNTGANGNGPGAINIAGSFGNGSLTTLDSETLNNATLTLSGSDGYGGVLLNSAAGQTLTLGSSLTVTQTSGYNQLQNNYNTGVIANAGTISIAGGTLNIYGGTFSNTGLLNVSAGVVYIGDAVSSPGSLATSGTGSIVLSSGGTFTGTVKGASANIAFQSGTLSAATWQGTLNIGTGVAYAAGGLAFTGANGSGPGTVSITGNTSGGDGYLRLLDAETLNNATLTLSGSGGYGGNIQNYAANQTLTLGNGFTVTETTGYNEFLNSYTGDVIANSGTIAIAGGTLSVVYGGFSNAGLVNVSAGVFYISSSVSSAGSLATSGTGSIVLSSGGTFTGTVKGGAANIAFQSGTLSSVAWQGTLNIGTGLASVIGGLTLTGADGTGPGALAISGSYPAGNGFLRVQDAETFNNATLTLSGGGGYGGFLQNYSTNQTLTLGASFVITETTGYNYLENVYSNGVIANAGTILVAGGTLHVSGGTFSNGGLVSVSAGAFSVDTTVTSAGSLATSGTGSIVLSNSGVFTGNVTANAANISFQNGTLSAVTWQGALNIGGGNAYVTGGLALTGANGSGPGALSISGGSATGNGFLRFLDSESLNNSTLTFSGSGGYGGYLQEYAANQTLTLGSGFVVTQTTGNNYLSNGYPSDVIVNAGTVSVAGGSLTVSGGTFSNTGLVSVSAGVFDIAATMTSLGSLATSGSGAIVLINGGTLSGTIAATSANFGFQSGTLSGVTWQGPLNIGTGIAFATGGLTVTGAGGTGAGAISINGGSGAQGFLRAVGSQSIDNATITLSGIGAYGGYLQNYGASQTLTLGPSLTVTQTVGSNTISNYSAASGVIANAGTISVGGGTLTLSGGTFSNSGLMTVSAGVLQINAINLANTGSIAIGGTGAFDVLNSALTFGAGNNITTTGSGVLIDDNGGSLLGTINCATLNVQYSGGFLTGVTYEGALAVSSSQTALVQGGLTLAGLNGIGQGTVTMAGGGLTVYDTETLNNATLTFTGTGGNLQGGRNYTTSGGSASTLTLGTGFTVVQTTGQNFLTASYGYNSGYYSDTIVNNGILSVTGGTLTARTYNTSGFGSFTNAGAINVSAGEFLINTVAFTNTGSIAVSGTGTLGLVNGTLVLGAGNNITTTGSGVLFDGNGGNLSGTLNTAAVSVAFGGGALEAITILGTLALAANVAYSYGGLTLAGADGTGTGAITLGNGGKLIAYQSETLSNGTLAFGSSSGAYLNTEYGATLTLASSFVVSQTGGTNYLGLTPVGSGGYGIIDNGTIAVGGGTLTMNNVLTVGAGGAINVSGGGVFYAAGGVLNNILGGTLTGGTYSVGAGSTLQLSNSTSITTDAANIVLSGAGSAIQSLYNNTQQVALDSTLATIAATGTLALLAGRGFSAVANTGTFTDNGLLSLGGGSFAATSLVLGATGTLAGYGTVSGPVADAGTITASGGTLTFGGAISGAGALAATAGATIDLTTGAALTEALSGAGTLQLDTGTYTLAGATDGFAATIIDSSATFSGTGTLTGAVSDAGTLSVTAGTLRVQGAVTGAGAINLAAGATLDLAAGGTLAGAIGGAGTLQLDGVAPLVLGAGASLAPAAVVIDAGATLDLTQGGALAGTLSGAGTLQLDGATPYTIAAGTTLAFGTVAIDAGASLTGAGTLQGTVTDAGTLTASGGTLLVTGALTGAGALTAGANATLDLAGSANLTQTVSGAGTLQLDTGTYTLSGASLGTAVVAVDAGATLSGFGTLTGATRDAGTLAASGGTLLLAGGLSGSGALSATASATADLRGGGALSEVISGAGTLRLENGTYTLGGASVAIQNVGLVTGSTLSGFGTLQGKLVDFGVLNAAGGTLAVLGAVSGTGAMSATGAADLLDLRGGGSLGGNITGAGGLKLESTTYTLAAAAISVAGLAVSSGATLSGTGTISSATTDAGAIVANGGTLLLSGELSGTGSLVANAGAVLDLSAGGSLTEALSGAGTLQLDGTTAYQLATGGGGLSIANVRIDAGATLNLAGGLALPAGITGAGTMGLATGTYTLAGGTEATASLRLASDATLSGFGTISGALADAGTLTATGGVLDLTGGADFAGAVNGAGTLQLDTGTCTLDGITLATAAVVLDAGATLSGSGTITGALSGAGTLSAAAASVLDVAGGGTFSGLLSGAGTLRLDSALTLQAGAALAAASVIDAANLTLGAGESLTNASGNLFDMVDTAGSTLTLAGAAGGTFTNAGTLAIDGPGTAAIAVAFANSGTVSVHSGTLLVQGAITDTGSLAVAAGSLLEFTGGGSLSGGASGAGTLQLHGSTAYSVSGAASFATAALLLDAGTTLSGNGTISGALTNNGTLVASGGKLVLAGALAGTGVYQAAAGAVLDLTAGGKLGTAISGAGTLELGGIYTTGTSLPAVANLAIDAGASLSGTGTIAGILADAGRVTASGGTLTVAGAFSGNGTLSAATGAVLDITHVGTLSGNVGGAGTIRIDATTKFDTGSSLTASNVIETANILMGTGVTLANAAGHIFTITESASATVSLNGQAGDKLSNGGSLIVGGAGNARIAVGVVNLGNIAVNSGTLSFQSALTNNGGITVGAATVIDNKSLAGTGAVTLGSTATLSLLGGATPTAVVDFAAVGGRLNIGTPNNFHGHIVDFAVGDTIDLLNTAATGFTYSGGVLTVTNNGAAVAHLHFTGSYSPSDFALATDNQGGTFITHT